MRGLALGILFGVALNMWMNTVAVIYLIGQPRTGTYEPWEALAYLVMALLVTWAAWRVTSE
jgi:hypothetical protein